MRFRGDNRAKRTGRAAILLVSLALQLPGSGRAQTATPPGCNLEPGPTRSVAAVVDAETVRLDDGKLVRLAGALAPRAFDAGAAASTWPPEEAARIALVALVQGRSVALAFGGRREDRYGRALAQLFLAEDSIDTERWIQGRMVDAGHARAAAVPETETCVAALLVRERRARDAGLGLWSHAAYQVRPADRPTELARYRDTFQIVAGRIERVFPGRTGHRLALVSSEAPAVGQSGTRRRQMHVVLTRDQMATLGEMAERLAGADIEARGWISGTGGAPEIAIAAGGRLEILSPGSPDAALSPTRQRASRKAKRPVDEPPGAEKR